ncbi:MAG: transaldolase family protein [Pseudomonadota bacterium]
MDLFLDTADVTVWDDLMPLGLFCGITTNPLLAAKAGLSYPDIDWAEMAARAARLGARELHGQVYGPPESYLDWAGRFDEAAKSAGLRPVVKVPLVDKAIRQVPSLQKACCAILMTACYDPKQVIIASALGADYIAPYFGRMLDAGLPAFDALQEMLNITRSSGNKTRILVASLRDSNQLSRLAEMGHDCFTISPSVTRLLLNDANTQKALELLEEAATQSYGKPG